MKKFAVLGSGITYTKSPLIHNEVFRLLGADARYTVENIAADALGENIERLFAEYDGLNVTVPFKKEIRKYVEADCAAVNTLLCAAREGYNTDGFGFYRDVTRYFGSVNGLDALIIGAGGAAEIVARTLTDAGAAVTIISRDKSKAAELAKRVGGASEITSPPELIVNCTPVGWDGLANPLASDISLQRLKYAYDLIYPTFVTPFLAAAKSAGAKIANGLGMLVYQAIKADELFLGAKIDCDDIYEKIVKKLSEENTI